MTTQDWEAAKEFFEEQENKVIESRVRDGVDEQTKSTILPLIAIARNFCEIMAGRAADSEKGDE